MVEKTLYHQYHKLAYIRNSNDPFLAQTWQATVWRALLFPMVPPNHFRVTSHTLANERRAGRHLPHFNFNALARATFISKGQQAEICDICRYDVFDI